MSTVENTESAKLVVPAVVTEETLTAAETENLALHTIKNHAITAMGIGMLPAPGVDLMGLTVVQLNLMRKLGNLYGQDLTDNAGKKVLSALLAGYLPMAVAAPAASLLKLIPGVGTAAGVLAQSSIAGATTYGLGKVIFNHLSEGGTFNNIGKESLKDLREEAREGKDFIKSHLTSSKSKAAKAI